VIESTNGVPIIVERSIYWNAETTGGWHGGTTVVALPVVEATYDGCQIAVSPLVIPLPAHGGERHVSFGATTRCTYAATTPAPWIRFPAGASGSGVGTITIAADANGTGSARTALISVAGRTVTVTQPAAGACGGTAPEPDWICIGTGWVPPNHPLANAPVDPNVPTPTPTPEPTPTSTPTPTPVACSTVRPAADWVCVGGDWVPPNHPMATNGGTPVPSPDPVPPPVPPSNECPSLRPAAGWVCVAGGLWVPPNHPLARRD
jgi:hypothetical protein